MFHCLVFFFCFLGSVEGRCRLPWGTVRLEPDGGGTELGSGVDLSLLEGTGRGKRLPRPLNSPAMTRPGGRPQGPRFPFEGLGVSVRCGGQRAPSPSSL